MTNEQYETFRHEAVHALAALNEAVKHSHRIDDWPRWDYDLEQGTLTFSAGGLPKVVASIQVVGSTSTISGTWLWSWANESIPASLAAGALEVRRFGDVENIPRLTEPSCPCDEYLGWEMTAVTACLIGAKGGYRCPGENGHLYVVYTTLEFCS